MPPLQLCMLNILQRWEKAKTKETLGVADEVDTITSVLHDGVDGLSEAFYLLPQRLQAGTPVKQIDHGHIGTWMRLGAAVWSVQYRGRNTSTTANSVAPCTGAATYTTTI